MRAGVEVERVDHDGEFHLRVGGEVLDADELLVAAGRSPNLADVGLETVGLDPRRRHRRDRRAPAGRRAALGGRRHHRQGRVHPRLALPGRRRGADILGKDGPPADYRAVSRVTFTDPELASVGLTEQQAREAGPDGPGRAGAGREVRAGLAARPGHHGRGQGGRGRRPRGAGRRDRPGAVRRRGDRHAGHRRARRGAGGAAADHALRLPDLPPDHRGGAAAAG